MKDWQIISLCALLGAAAGAVVAFKSGPTVIEQVNEVRPQPSPTPEPPKPITLLFAGDIMLSRSVGTFMAANNDWVWPFRRIASTTAEADLAFANLETTISTRGVKTACGFCFRSDPRAIEGLVHAGFDVLSVANNHTGDYGPQALTDTTDILKAAGISPVGGSHNPVIREVRGTKIAYLAYTNILQNVFPFTVAQMQKDISVVRPMADIVVVSFHTGTEYETIHNAKQESIYTAAIDAGADLVVGHHPHVLQEVVAYKNGWIAYSLGNFVFDQNFSINTRTSMILSIEINNKKIEKVAKVPVIISTDYQPALVASGSGQYR